MYVSKTCQVQKVSSRITQKQHSLKTIISIFLCVVIQHLSCNCITKFYSSLILTSQILFSFVLYLFPSIKPLHSQLHLSLFQRWLLLQTLASSRHVHYVLLDDYIHYVFKYYVACMVPNHIYQQY